MWPGLKKPFGPRGVSASDTLPPPDLLGSLSNIFFSQIHKIRAQRCISFRPRIMGTLVYTNDSFSYFFLDLTLISVQEIYDPLCIHVEITLFLFLVKINYLYFMGDSTITRWNPKLTEVRTQVMFCYQICTSFFIRTSF
jgi:hypothetical protein